MIYSNYKNYNIVLHGILVEKKKYKTYVRATKMPLHLIHTHKKIDLTKSYQNPMGICKACDQKFKFMTK